MKLFKQLGHIAIACCLGIFFAPTNLASMNENDYKDDEIEIEMNEINNNMEALQLEVGDAYFTPQNTAILVITAESIANFITKNSLLPQFNPQGLTLADLSRNLNFKAFKNVTGDDQRKILLGMNEFRKLGVLDQFHVHCIDVSSPQAYDLILQAVGDVIGQYFYQDDRPYGFNFIMLLKDQTELWICEIPSKSEVESVLSGKRKPLRTPAENEELPFTGKEGEVYQALTMFEPLLNKLFIEGRSQEVQERRKAFWTCCKGTAVVIAIIVVAIIAFGGVVAAIISAASSLESSANQP